MDYDVVVIGAGQAGLAAGYHLQRRGFRFIILEAQTQPAGSWPHYYESLKLFSPARYSSLPGMAFPGAPDRYPLRDEVVAYLTAYAERFQLPIELNTRVARVEREGDRFRVTATDGREYGARTVIAATGAFSHPHVPSLPGQAEFQGTLIHSKNYLSPAPFAGKRVVVVGAGNSAVQIATELARTARVTLATRQPVKFLPQRLLGKDIHFWLIVTGLDTLPLGYWTKVGTSTGVLDTGVYRAALSAGKPDRRPMFTEFTPGGVRWPDGMEESVDAVIFATGYLPGLSYLVGLGALDESGWPCHRGGVSRTVPGLYFVGLSGQRSNASATLRGVGADAAHVIRHLKGFLPRLEGSRPGGVPSPSGDGTFLCGVLDAARLHVYNHNRE